MAHHHKLTREPHLDELVDGLHGEFGPVVVSDDKALQRGVELTADESEVARLPAVRERDLVLVFEIPTPQSPRAKSKTRW